MGGNSSKNWACHVGIPDRRANAHRKHRSKLTGENAPPMCGQGVGMW
jgi:hypothetical protein